MAFGDDVGEVDYQLIYCTTSREEMTARELVCPACRRPGMEPEKEGKACNRCGRQIMVFCDWCRVVWAVEGRGA